MGTIKAHYTYIILGGGLCGMTTALQLTENENTKIAILEKEPTLGGLCKSLRKNNSRYDLGSHRIHAATHPFIMSYLENNCASKIQSKKRQGKLKLQQHFIRYPVQLINLLFSLGLIETIHCCLSFMATKIIIKSKRTPDNYRLFLIHRVGKRLYELFYEPYAYKMWGIDPISICASGVKKRIAIGPSLSQVWKLLRSILPQPKPIYFYPEKGFSSIIKGIKKNLRNKKCNTYVNIENLKINQKTLSFTCANTQHLISYEKIISTIPVNELCLYFHKIPAKIKTLTENIKWRSLQVIYLHIPEEPKLTGETFYFPEKRYIFGRVSIPRRFSEKFQKTRAYCYTCEVICSADNTTPSQALYERCYHDLISAGLISGKKTYTKKLTFMHTQHNVYPIYTMGWQKNIKHILQFIQKKNPALYVCGRSGLFLHCNIDTVIIMALILAKQINKNKSVRDWYSFLSYLQNIKLKD